MNKWYSDEELRQREAMCFECMSESCAYACDGLCHLPLVCGFEPEITDDGCGFYVYDSHD